MLDLEFTHLRGEHQFAEVSGGYVCRCPLSAAAASALKPGACRRLSGCNMRNATCMPFALYPRHDCSPKACFGPTRPGTCPRLQLVAQDVILEPLEDDCRLLQSLLDGVLRIEIGPELLQKACWAQPQLAKRTS